MRGLLRVMLVCLMGTLSGFSSPREADPSRFVMRATLESPPVIHLGQEKSDHLLAPLWRTHRVLAPGGTLLIATDGRDPCALLVLDRTSKAPSLEELRFQVSQDGRLFRDTIPVWHDDLSGFRLGEDGPRVYRVTRPADRKTPLRLAARRTAANAMQPLLPPRALPSVSEAAVARHRTLSFVADRRQRDYYFLEAGQSLSFEAGSLGSVTVETRLSYADQDPAYRRTYRLKVTSGDVERRVVLETTPSPHLVNIADAAHLLGHPKWFSHALAGSRLTVTTNQALFMRVTSAEDRFLLDRFSAADWAPVHPFSTPHLPRLRETSMPRSKGDGSDRHGSQIFSQGERWTSGAGETALAHLQVLRAKTTRHPHDRELLLEAARFAARHTYFRQVPLVEDGSRKFRTLNFTPATLATVEAPVPRYTAPRFLSHTESRTRSARFIGVHPGESLMFQLPNLATPPRIRLITALPAAGETPTLTLSVKGIEHRFTFSDEVPAAWLEGNALTAGGWSRLGAMDRVTGVPCGPRAKVGQATLDLPLATARLALKIERETDRESQPHGPLWIRLEVMRGKPFRLEEKEHEEAVSHLERSPFQAFLALLQGRRPEWRPGDPDIRHRLRWALHYEPLARTILTLHHGFLADPDCEPLSPVRSESLSGRELQALRTRAETDAGNGDVLAALTRYSEAFHRSGDLSDRMRRNEMLVALGEWHLARTDLRDLLVKAPDREMRLEASWLLTEIHRLTDDRSAQIAMIATMVVLDGHQEDLVALVALFHGEGRFREVLDGGLLLDRPDRHRLRDAAWTEGWWRLATRMTMSMAEREEAALDRGVRAAVEGRPQEALDHLARAGKRGASWRAALTQGLDLGERLLAPFEALRFPALLDLEHWWRAHPGPRTYAPTFDSVLHAAGEFPVSHRGRDLEMTFFRGTEETPVAMIVAGPARIRLEMRPIHQVGDGGRPLDGFVTIGVDGLPRRLAYLENHPSATLQLAARVAEIPGSAIFHELDLGPGAHRLEVWGSRPLLVSPDRLVVAVPILPLPPLAPAAFEACAEKHTDLESLEHRQPESRFLILDDGSTAPLPEPRPRSWVDPGPADPLLQARASLRTDEPDVDLLAQWLDGLSDPKEREAALLALYSSDPRRYRAELVTRVPSLERPLLLGEGRLREACAVPARSDSEALQKMALLLERFAVAPEEGLDLQVQAEALILERPDLPTLKRLAMPFDRAHTWRQVRHFDRVAGTLRQKDETVSPQWAVRAALVPPDPDTHLLLGTQRIAVRFDHGAPKRLRVQLAVESPGYLPPLPATCFLRWNVGSEIRKRLEPGRHWQEFDLAPPPGARDLAIGGLDPRRNQLIRVRLFEETEAGPVAIPPQRTDRTYRVASPNEPIRLSLFEPAMIRVDRLRGDAVESEQLLFRTGPSELVLRADREPSYYRVFRMGRRDVGEGVAALRPRVAWEPNGYAPTAPPESLVSTPAIGSGPWRAGYLGRFSHEFGLSFVNRELSDDQRIERADRDRFLQVGYTARRHVPRWNLYSRSRVLVRLREDVGHSFGLEQRFHLRRERYELALTMAAYIQFLEDVRLDFPPGFRRNFDDPYATTTRLSLLTPSHVRGRWRFRTRGGVFRHYLGMDVQPPGPLDWDLFTDYRVNHQYGLNLEQEIRFLPYHDTRLELDFGLIGNESWDADPVDQYRIRLSWDQLLGRFEAGLSLRARFAMADKHRRRTDTEWTPGISLAREVVTAGGHRRLAGLRFQFDPSDKASNFSLFWRNGVRIRGNYGDYLPGEIEFEPIRLRQIALDPSRASATPKAGK
ncbi:hypothetical protein SCOR_16660 [Sulfidibacter corallicola]|uniref:Uncharacterized protein n=1 Tax=Sulfidibacter corallicola TaxID=2818388 RepID=A0A8A4TVC1_SULCO|nr:hypothetical protein [Sulfidibacter corallicola]QTD53906.1 hypothetical protein J3U87_15770 [Sulfidibacter corallicola]